MTNDDLAGTTANRIFDAFRQTGMTNHVEILDQVSHLLYLRELDLAQERWDQAATPSHTADYEPIFDQDQQHLRWSQLVDLAPQRMFTAMNEEVFPWMRSHAFAGLVYSRHVHDSSFAIPTPGLLAKVVGHLEEALSAANADAVDLYEHLVAKVATEGRSSVPLTPPLLSALMVAMAAPGVDDEVCDPTCGMGGLLVAAAQYVHRIAPGVAQADSTELSRRIHGFDCNSTMLRLSSLRLLFQGAGSADVRHRDNLRESMGMERERYSVILANLPFGGYIGLEAAPELVEQVKTKRSEVLHLAALLGLLKSGGRAVVIVPDELLHNSSLSHIELRRRLVDEHGLEAVVTLPRGTFEPNSGVSAAILYFVKDAGRASNVWFYELKADGLTQNPRRTPLLVDDKLGLYPHSVLDAADHARNNLPDLIQRWQERHNGSERRRDRSEQSFCVASDEIASADYTLALEQLRQIDARRRARKDGIRLGDFAKIFPGTVRSADLAKKPDGTDAEKQHRVLTPALLTSTLPGVMDLPVRADEREPQHRLRPGDIIGRDLASARHWMSVPGEYDGVQPGQGLIVIRMTREALPHEYVTAYLSSPLAKQQFPKYGTIPRIKVREMANIWIPKCDGDFSEIRTALAMLKEGTLEAQRIQHELDHARNQVFETGSGSTRLVRLNEAAAISSLTAQNLRRHNDPYTLFQDSYPYAIARAVRRFRHALSLAEKHEAALQCADSLIISLGIAALALAAQRGRRDLSAVVQWRESIEKGGVSLGDWVGVVREVAEDARLRGDAAAGLARATAKRRHGKGLLADLDALVEIRNSIRHGAGPRTRAELEASLAKIEPLMLSGLSGSNFLARTKWVYADRLQWLPNSARFRVTGLALMGDHPDFASASFEAAQPLEDDRVYLVAPDNAPLPLSPFCLLRDCPTCLAPELYYSDRMKVSTAVLKSLDRGHELDSDAIFTEMRDWDE